VMVVCIFSGSVIEVYTQRLKTEFGYINKDMKADEDLREMEARIAVLEKRG